MINQVGFQHEKYPFVPFKGGGINFDAPKPIAESQNDEFKKEEKKQKEQKTRHFGRSILAIALLAGLGLFAGDKFFSKAAGAKTQRWGKKLARTMSKDGRDGLWGSVKQMFRVVIRDSQVIFNVATLKDILFVKSLKKIPFINSASARVTGLFERLSIATSKRAYDKTTLAFESMYGKFNEANKLLTKDQAGVVNSKIQIVRDRYYSGFGDAARKERLSQVQVRLKDLDEKVWKETYRNPKGFLAYLMEGKFVAEEEAKKAKVELLSAVMQEKFKISNSPDDCYHATKKVWDKLHYRIHAGDKRANDIMRQISGYLNDYHDSLKVPMRKRARFPKDEVLHDLKELRTHIPNQNDYYDEDKVKLITKAIDSLHESMSKTQKGEIQKILEIYEKHLPQPEFIKLKKSVDKTLLRLNKSADMEHDKLFDKIRDLKLGSAPHDVLAFLGSLGVIGWGVSKADSRDEKISVTLKYAIPALFGVAMAIGCTVGLIASGPSLLIGLASTIPINMIGKAIDNARKKKDDEPQASILPAFKFESPLKLIKDIENNAKNMI